LSAYQIAESMYGGSAAEASAQAAGDLMDDSPGEPPPDLDPPGEGGAAAEGDK